MRSTIAICLLLLTAACDDPDNSDGSTGEVDETAESSSTGDDESGSSGDMFEEWSGEAMFLRVIEAQSDRCEYACGASQCLGSTNTDTAESIRCDESAANVECTCADLTEQIEESPASNAVVSECYLNPNSNSRLAVDPPLWDASLSCDDYCGAFGFTCYGTMWGELKNCPRTDGDDWDIYEDGPVVRPDDVPGPDGVFRVLCEI